ncbi:transient receptor potential cation channel subfamily A member 1 isoform X2 [Nematostella vectensis]|uniref:transient receptor potential cation channel subfamily A member 1 isoform X2 n=1 Tax=Nematostella vectensis TaxID=45351 RepID=UPI0020777737|nr:transient receptor potential cation channel subfamily A member 1 isoform X2 [Nematostella vectensis]
MSSRETKRVKPMIGNNEIKEMKTFAPSPRVVSTDDTQQALRRLCIAAQEDHEDEIRYFKNLSNLVNCKDSVGFTILQHVARLDKPEILEILLDAGADIDTKGPEGYTALHLATRFNCYECVKILLQHNADQTVGTDEGTLAMHAASRHGYQAITKLLLDSSHTCVNSTMLGDLTPLAMSCMNGHYETCKLLIDSGANIVCVNVEKRTPLHLAAIQGDHHVVKLLIDSAISKGIKLGDFIDVLDYEFNTPLHLACTYGREEAVHELLKNGADVNAQCMGSGETPLHISARRNKVMIMEELLAKGATVDCRDSASRTPLHRAAFGNQIPAVQLLISKGATKDARDSETNTPFLLAVKYNKTQAAAELLKRGADIKAKNLFFLSSLHLAVSLHKDCETLKLLLEWDDGSLLSATDLNLQTPLHFAAARGSPESINLLLGKNCEIDAKDANDQCPLHIAASNGSVEAARILAHHSPEAVFSRDSYGHTPIHKAASHGYWKTCEALLKNMSSTRLRDLNFQTPLHSAVTSGSIQTVKTFLGRTMDSNVLLEMQDSNGNTALHLACANDEVKIVKLLLDEGADVTMRNKDDKTCLDVAIDWERTEVAKALIQHDRWWEVMCTRNSAGELPMVGLIEALPDVAKLALDQCIERCPLPTSHQDYCLTFHTVLLDPGPCKEGQTSRDASEVMVENDCEELLSHPVTQVLLRYKWFAFGKVPYYINLMVFLIFVILFSYFIITERDSSTLYYHTHPNASALEKQYLEKRPSSSNPIAIVLILFATIEFLKEFYQIFMIRLDYFKDITNLVELVLYTCAIIFISPYLAEEPLYTAAYGHWNAGVVTLFLAYLNVLLYIKGIGSSGLYVTMYFEVWYTFLKVIMVFLVVLLGSTLVYYVLLKEEDNFSGVHFAFVKTFVMMVGEIDYNDVLSSNVINREVNPATGAPYVPLPPVTYVFFFVFVVMVPILLMNLLVGLAVGDIDAIQKTASFSRLKDQVNYVTDIQRRYPLKMIRMLYKEKIDVRPNRNRFWKRSVPR